jgi:hypothetical protein
MSMLTSQLFSYFDSRNNNFSNRMNKGVICVGGNCPLQNGTNVLQDVNPGLNGNMIVSSAAPVNPTLIIGANQVDSPCASTSMTLGAAANGVQSCIAPTPAIITTPTTAGNEGDNDNKGDGTGPAGCAQLTYSADSIIGVSTVEQQVVLAVVLFFVGLVLAWLAYYMYNRYRARTAGVSKFRYDATWQKTDNNTLSASDPNATSVSQRVAGNTRAASSDLSGSVVQLASKKNSEFI